MFKQEYLKTLVFVHLTADALLAVFKEHSVKRFRLLRSEGHRVSLKVVKKKHPSFLQCAVEKELAAVEDSWRMLDASDRR